MLTRRDGLKNLWYQAEAKREKRRARRLRAEARAARKRLEDKMGGPEKLAEYEQTLLDQVTFVERAAPEGASSSRPDLTD